MAVYRIYLVHEDGRLDPAESFYCKTDSQALNRLKPSVQPDVRTELWQGGRFIGAAAPARRGPMERLQPRP